MVDIPAAADLGTHSAHCARPWTFTGTVLAGCDVVLWLVAQKTVESPQLQWLGVVQFLDKIVVPVGATTGSAQCLVRQWIPFLRQFTEGFMEDFSYILREGAGSSG